MTPPRAKVSRSTPPRRDGRAGRRQGRRGPVPFQRSTVGARRGVLRRRLTPGRWRRPEHGGGSQGSLSQGTDLDADLVPAIVNLANIHYASDELIERRRSTSVRSTSRRTVSRRTSTWATSFTTWDDTIGRLRATAMRSYSTPSYADAHFYLAVTLEKTGHSLEAKPHWKAYQDLAPRGEWIGLAREFTE